MAWLNTAGPSVLGPNQTDNWWWWFEQSPQMFVMQAVPQSAGGQLTFGEQSVQINLDGTATYFISVTNSGPSEVQYLLLGEFMTQPA